MKNKVVVVTGASSGIGKACATYFAYKGSKVVLSARSHDTLKSISNSLNKKGYDTTYVVTDVCKESDCRHLIDQTLERYKKDRCFDKQCWYFHESNTRRFRNICFRKSHAG